MDTHKNSARIAVNNVIAPYAFRCALVNGTYASQLRANGPLLQ
jgi:hypothetical protein